LQFVRVILIDSLSRYVAESSSEPRYGTENTVQGTPIPQYYIVSIVSNSINSHVSIVR